MLINQSFSWPATTWPTTLPATQYAVFQVYPTGVSTPLQMVTTTLVTLTYDDTQNLVYQVRATDGILYGPEITTIVLGYVPCRAYIRQRVRFALSDQANTASSQINWTDDEINSDIAEGLNELSLLFPSQADTTIQLQSPAIIGGSTVGVRAYTLPTDCYKLKTVEYITQDGRVHLYLREKPFRGGESTATTYLGYPKLGIMLSPLAGRFYPGHYDQYENQIFLDWDPAGDGDFLHIRYAARYPLLTDDSTPLNVRQEDLELLSLYAQMKCWIRVEGQDTRLSRWRSKEDGAGSRDALPTAKMSKLIKQLYDQRLNDRRELRVRTFRLVRR
jgi:hypothetical protein